MRLLASFTIVQRAAGLGLVLLLLLPALALLSGLREAKLSANLLELLPQQSHSAAEQQAITQIQSTLHRDLWLLLGHPDADQLPRAAAQLSQTWQRSGLFVSVEWQFQQDLAQVRQSLKQARIASLPLAAQAQLNDDAARFIDGRSARLLDPFRPDLLPPQEDWLGFASLISANAASASALTWQATRGTLERHAHGQQWLLIRAQSLSDAFALDTPQQIANLLSDSQRTLQAQGFSLLASSGLLHAAAAQTQAQREINLVGGGGLLGIVLLLCLSFRSARALSALLPVCTGMLAGVLVSLCLFSSVHVLTLVLGCSLIGVAIDYPLHVLAKRWQPGSWHPEQALQQLLPSLTLGLLTSVLGYLALSAAPFPALQQVAVFSAAGLMAAFGCVICVLPKLIRALPAHPAPALLQHSASRWLNWRWPRSALLLVMLLAAFGLPQITWSEGLKQWISSPAALLEQEQAFADISGQRPTSQFFLLEADDLEQLLQRERALLEALKPLQQAKQLGAVLSIAERYNSPAQQTALQLRLQQLAQTPLDTPHWQALGVSPALLQSTLHELAALPVLSLADWLQSPLGQPYQTLWLGEQNGTWRSIVSLNQLQDSQLLHALPSLPGVRLINPLGDVQTQLLSARQQALWLVLLAAGLMLALLCLRCGYRLALRLAVVPALALLLTVSLLGLLQVPLTLFSVFALLLVLAVGVDYAIFLQQQHSLATACGLCLQALTTLLSFGLLALSNTPAISSFGLCLALGISLSLLLAPLASPPTARSHHGRT
ncbi:MMPL family transporter [Atopomonas sediminilitoris]|uniref:MMPL family transporter n=1 Tax=Atopomonas sediminilitoris TaxID=2919919 RepID=UPI001F4E85B1|nr:hypothetical protein [Atopomonas sediminilitoris]MCJ8170375.1 hypothetical protein [Atopomonas sediminilitoris]